MNMGTWESHHYSGKRDSPEITFKRNRIRHWPVSSVTDLDNFKIQLHGGNYYGSTAQFNSYEL